MKGRYRGSVCTWMRRSEPERDIQAVRKTRDFERAPQQVRELFEALYSDNEIETQAHERINVCVDGLPR